MQRYIRNSSKKFEYSHENRVRKPRPLPGRVLVHSAASPRCRARRNRRAQAELMANMTLAAVDWSMGGGGQSAGCQRQVEARMTRTALRQARVMCRRPPLAGCSGRLSAVC